MENKENKENKIKAVKLSEDELENVSGGYSGVVGAFLPQLCDICGAYARELYLYGDKCYCSACKEKAGF